MTTETRTDDSAAIALQSDDPTDAAARPYKRTAGGVLSGNVLPPVVQVIDGGTAGMELLESLEDLDKLIIADCVRVGQPPATVSRPTRCS